jgi:hypothetical protein
MATSTSSSTIEIILDKPEHYHAWFSAIQDSVPEDLWPYFDPEDDEEYEKPEPVLFSTIRAGATTLANLTAAERSQYATLRSVYNHDVTQYQRFLSEQAKLRTKIRNTVSETKKHQLQADESVRDWLTHLETSTKPTDAQMKDIIRVRHRTLLGAKYVDWPTAGPEKWITEWQKLMIDCETWCPTLHEDWASDFNLVWGEVPGAKRLCDRLVEAISSGNIDDWDIYQASRELRQAWDQKSIRSGMKVASRGKITRAAFAVEPRFDGMPPNVAEDEQDEPTSADKPSRKRAGTETAQKEGNQRGHKKNKKPCWGCLGSHSPHQCVLISGHNARDIPIPPECQKAFDDKMKSASFAKKIRIIREANKIKRNMAADVDED